MEAFVDIHCHILPGIDDGPGDWDESLSMARMAVADGIGTIVATPHQLGSHGQNTAQQIRSLTAELQRRLELERIDLSVLPGADVRIEPDLVAKIRTGEVLTLGDRGHSVLLELPHEVYLPLDRLVAELRTAGMIPILSHPERNAGIQMRPEVVEPLIAAGCLMQVTAGSLYGAFGRGVKSLAERLVGHGMAHLLATDAHGTGSRSPLLKQGFDRVAELAGPAAAMELCCTNPARVLAGEQVSHAKSRGVAGWFRSWRNS